MVGTQILKLYDQRINQSYAQNEGTARKQMRLNRALRMLVDRLMAKNDSQVEMDQLSNFNRVDKEFFPFEGKVHLGLNPSSEITQLSPGIIRVVTKYESLASVGSVVEVVIYTGAGTPADYTVLSVIDKFSFTVAGTLPITPTTYSGTVSIEGRYILDYMRFEKAHVESASGFMYVGALVKFVKCGSENQIVFHAPTKIRTGTRLFIKGTAISGLDGYHYAKLHGIRSVGLFQDKSMSIPSEFGALTWPNTGEVLMLTRAGARIRKSDQKISSFHEYDSFFPQVEFAERKMFVYPPDATSVFVDYYGADFVEIDLTNSTTNYTNFYTPKFIDKIIDLARTDFLTVSNEIEAANFNGQQDIVLNP